MAVPGTPSNFYLQQGNTSVTASWDLTATALSYKIQRSTDGITYATIASGVVNLYYTDTTVTVGTLYYYQIAATNGFGDSPFTSPQSVVSTVPGNMTLGQARALAQQKADMVNSSFVTVPEWNTYIRQSYFELYDMLIGAFEDWNVYTPLLIPTDGATTLYSLPNGIATFSTFPTGSAVAPSFYKLLGLDLGLAGNNLRYRLVGDKLMLIPTPSTGQFVRLWYIPRLVEPVKDSDMLDGISGWDEYVCVDAAIKAGLKEETDVSALMAQKMMLVKRIEEMSQNRDAGEPDTISDSRSRAEQWGVYGPPNGDGGSGGW
jgi:hypothetical protein